MTDEQLAVRVAWLYYLESLTQDKIGARLGLTRLKVNRLLAEARESGLVSIAINSRVESCLRTEEALCRQAGLREAVVVPSPEDPEQLPALLGRALADFVSRHLKSNRVSGLGVGWGATLREAIRHVRPAHLPRLNVNSMMGGLTQGLEINTFETASALAQRLHARCTYLAAPLYASSAASREIILAQDVFRTAFDAMLKNDLALLSLGDLSRRSLLIRYGLPDDVSVASLRKAGAVGDIVGQFLDPQGRPVTHPINGRALAPTVTELGRIPTVVVAAGGAAKTRIITAVLRARLAAVLVCDEATARAALDAL